MNNYSSTSDSLSERELKLLKGADFKPITRREMYIRALYNQAQDIPKPITKEDKCFCIAIANIRGAENGNEF
jgi:hypothetical protein